jgi:hypothetical protein
VCSDHFKEVVVIDPDNEVLLERARAEDALLKPWGSDDLAAGSRRPRVMQYNAYHAGQPIYWAGLRRLFPTMGAEIKKANVK